MPRVPHNRSKPQFLTANEAAQLLGWTLEAVERLVQQLVADGKIVTIGAGLIPQQDLLDAYDELIKN
jgi:DNA-binding Lrp family transcriptional regulator